jgi:hypothetical protein
MNYFAWTEKKSRNHHIETLIFLMAYFNFKTATTTSRRGGAKGGKQ